MKIEYDLLNTPPDFLAKEITQKIFQSLSEREMIGLFDEYIEWLKVGRKTTTIRYCPGKIDCPQKYLLPLLATSSQTRIKGAQVGWARLTKLQLKEFGDLNSHDAINDGFYSLDELKEALINIYGNINNNSIVSIYTIEFIEKH